MSQTLIGNGLHFPRAAAVAGMLVILSSLGGCSSSFSPSLPDVVPFPTKLLTAEQQKKAVEELSARKDSQVTEAEREIKAQR